MTPTQLIISTTCDQGPPKLTKAAGTNKKQHNEQTLSHTIFGPTCEAELGGKICMRCMRQPTVSLRTTTTYRPVNNMYPSPSVSS